MPRSSSVRRSRSPSLLAFDILCRLEKGIGNRSEGMPRPRIRAKARRRNRKTPLALASMTIRVFLMIGERRSRSRFHEKSKRVRILKASLRHPIRKDTRAIGDIVAARVFYIPASIRSRFSLRRSTPIGRSPIGVEGRYRWSVSFFRYLEISFPEDRDKAILLPQESSSNIGFSAFAGWPLLCYRRTRLFVRIEPCSCQSLARALRSSGRLYPGLPVALLLTKAPPPPVRVSICTVKG